MIDWQFFSKRRGVTLKKFLSGVTTLDEAHERFQNRDLVPPQDSEILELLGPQPEAKKEPAPKVTKKPQKQTKQPEPASTEKPAQTNAPAKTTKDKPVKKKAKSKKDEKYFRRVFPAKDKS